LEEVKSGETEFLECVSSENIWGVSSREYFGEEHLSALARQLTSSALREDFDNAIATGSSVSDVFDW
jgi:hypothetical protein